MLLFLDWDETITSHDTLSTIAPPSGSQLHGPDFDYYAKHYVQDMTLFAESFGERTSLEKQLAYLQAVDEVELMSVNRVEAQGLFKGVKYEEILSRAETVQYRDGWEKFDAWLLEEESVFSEIISVGWSASFIRHSLRYRRPEKHKHIEVPRKIHANEVEMDAFGVGTGKLSKSESSMRTGFHKLSVMKQEIASLAEEDCVTVYVGDSNTDLPCLLHSDWGLIMGDNSSLQRTIENTGLSEKVVTAEDWRIDVEEQRLIKVKDWTDALHVVSQIMNSQR